MVIQSLHQNRGGDNEKDFQCAADDSRYDKENAADCYDHGHGYPVRAQKPPGCLGESGQVPQDETEAEGKEHG